MVGKGKERRGRGRRGEEGRRGNDTEREAQRRHKSGRSRRERGNWDERDGKDNGGSEQFSVNGHLFSFFFIFYKSNIYIMLLKKIL